MMTRRGFADGLGGYDVYNAMRRSIQAGVTLGLALWAASPAIAQDTKSAISALARITCEAYGHEPTVGSGFVVALEGHDATIVTASHVVEGARCKVELSGSTDRLPVERVLGHEAGDRHGLAALRVRGVPAGVGVLELDAETPIDIGTELMLAGFPQLATRPGVKQGVFSRPEGKLLLVDRAAGEGASGGPVLRGGKAVGVITAGGVGEEFAYAVNAEVARSTLKGWDVQLEAPQQGSQGPSTGEPVEPEIPTAKASNIAVAIGDPQGDVDPSDAIDLAAHLGQLGYSAIHIDPGRFGLSVEI